MGRERGFPIATPVLLETLTNTSLLHGLLYLLVCLVPYFIRGSLWPHDLIVLPDQAARLDAIGLI